MPYARKRRLAKARRKIAKAKQQKEARKRELERKGYQVIEL